MKGLLSLLRSHGAIQTLSALATSGAATLDSISGGAGWVGAGLLGAVLWWLMFKRLPANDQMTKDLIADKDRDIRNLLASKDAQINLILEHKWQILSKMSSDHQEAIKALAAEFRCVTVEVSRHCEEEINRLFHLSEDLRSGTKQKEFSAPLGDSRRASS